MKALWMETDPTQNKTDPVPTLLDRTMRLWTNKIWAMSNNPIYKPC